MEKNYKVFSGISFDERTPDEVCKVIANAYDSNKRQRLKFYFGDVETGSGWNDEYDTVGYIGRSTGSIKIPLLIKKINSMGGGSILDHCILKIKDVKSGTVLFQRDNYQASKVEIVKGDMEGYPYNTMVNGLLYGRHKTELSAKITKNKIQ